MTTISANVASILFQLGREKNPEMRQITGPTDFGDDGSIGCALKSVDTMAGQQFARFAGKFKDGYVAVIIDFHNRITGGQVFETLDEMYHIWTVD